MLDSKIFNENLVAVHKIKETLTLNRPAYVGMCILDLSKTLMSGADPGEVKWVNFHPPFFLAPFFLKVLVFRPFQFQEKEKTKSGYKHNKKVSHGVLT